MTKYVLSTFMLLLTLSGTAQQKTIDLIDSLKRSLGQPGNDSNYSKQLYKIAEQYYLIDPASSVEYSKAALQHAKKINWKPGIANANGMLGRGMIQMGNYDSAIIFLREAARIYNDIGAKDKMAFQFGNIGVTLVTQKKYPEAQQAFFETLKLAEEINAEGLKARVLGSISYVFDMQKSYDKALEYALKSVEQCEKLKDSTALNEAYRHTGSVYGIMKNKPQAELYLEKARVIYELRNDKVGLADLYQELSAINDDNINKKLSYCLKTQEIFNELGLVNTMSIANTGEIGSLFFRLAKADSSPPSQELLAKSVVQLEKAIKLAKENNHILLEADFSIAYSEVLFAKGDFKRAYQLKDFGTKIRDSVFSQENKNKIAEAESKYEIEKKDAQIAINQLTISNQQKQRVGLILGLCLLGIIGGLVYWQSANRKKSNAALQKLNKELDEANRIKATFFAILSHDLRSPIANLINFLQLQEKRPGLLSVEEVRAQEQKIQSTARNLLENMEDLLLWSKGQMEKFKPEFRAVAVDDLFDHLRKSFASVNNIAFVFDNSGRLTLWTDEHYLKTIMHNLTANAVKALDQSLDPQIVWTAATNERGPVLAISDNGPGVRSEQVKSLWQESMNVNTRTGFGLHLIRDLAKAINCGISLREQSGAGTSFEISFAEQPKNLDLQPNAR